MTVPRSGLAPRLAAFLVLLLPGFASGQTPPPTAQATCGTPVARLVSLQGTINLRRAGGATLRPAALNESYCPGDVLELGASSRAAIQLPDQTVVSLDQGTVVTFAAPQDDKRTWLDVLKGALHIIARDPRALRVVTPFANAGIEGTEFLVQVSADSAAVLVFEGRVKVENATGAATAASGQRVVARAGAVPVLEQVVRPRDQVLWTLYYPPTGAGADPRVARAEEQLAVGRVAEAEVELAGALRASPGNVEVLARQSVIALTRNDAARAATLADEAVAAGPSSAAARLAQSYVRQSAGDLPGAVATLEEAAKAEPGNALVKARLAELYLASGDVARSEATATAASTADPTLGLARTILGFARLARIDLPGATAAFDEAIRLEPWAPLPRLGRGLALIRGGDLAAGRSEIETAVILDPNNSLVRSYMGKAYYEEKRDKLAASQLEIAKELDPNDPTPWFYDAIRKQTLNLPVEALKDLDTAVRLNENRNVYRSRFQLDQDLAARSASQGRIYQDLGFGELALRAGARSVQVAPTDFSGHRLLADSYSLLPRHEIARVNELFQSQVLQPLNVNPVQPQLGEANLSVVDSGGPGNIAFNEFNPLFNRDRLAAQGSAVVGNKNTLGADGVLAGVEGRMSFSLGAYTYESDGFRTNNDVDERTYNALLQFQQSPSTSWLAEVRDAQREFGELKLLYLNQVDAGLPRQEENSTNFRVGVRHDLAPGSTVAAFVNYATGDTGLAATEPFLIGDTDFDTWTAEAQYLHTAERWRLVTGARVFTGDFDDSTTARIELPDPPFLIEQTFTSQFSTRSLAAYAYVTADVLPEKLWVTLGASADHLNGQTFDDQRVNPKFGVTWVPNDRTEVRLGALTTLQRPAVTRQEFVPSLEPTTISGFNQFYFGSEGEKDERYGVGIDHRLGTSASIGAEYSEAELKVPFQEFVFTPPDIFDFVDRSATVDEKSGRAWLYWIPGDKGSLRALYDYYDVDTPVLTPLRYNRLETHAFSVAASYFDPRGFSAGMVPKYVHQRGRFQDITIPFATFEPDSDSFVVVDAFASFRLPLRSGILRLEVNNLFDSEFNFQDVDPERSRVAPERFVLAKVTVAY